MEDIVSTMLSVNPYSEHVSARLLDFFGHRTLWQRRLWGVGICLVLHEILEASQAVQAGALSEAALKNLCEDALRLARPDPAFHHLMGTLAAQLREERAGLAPQGHRHAVIRHVADEAAKNYLGVWAGVVESSQRPKPERAARAIASHLLDAGFNSQYLHRKWTYLVHHEPGQRTLGAILEEFNALVQQPPRPYDILVALQAKPKMRSPHFPPNWREAAWVANWIKVNLGRTGPRQYGGLIFSVKARDPWSAIEQVAETVGQLAARFAVGTGSRLMPTEFAWVMNEREEIPLRFAKRGVEIGALDRNSKLFEQNPANKVDAAIELLAPLDDGPPGPASAGAWSAVEALLSAVDDGENVSSADRLASLIACSFPRAELTRLAYAHRQNSNDALAVSIAGAITNRERAQCVEKAIKSGAQLALVDASDRAAMSRIVEVMAEPRKKLVDIEAHARSAIRRLYRQRNLVLHDGNLGAVALRASLRTVAPLIGAGIDRIAHAAFVHGTEPMMLAAMARVQLDLLGRDLPGDVQPTRLQADTGLWQILPAHPFPPEARRAREASWNTLAGIGSAGQWASKKWASSGRPTRWSIRAAQREGLG